MRRKIITVFFVICLLAACFGCQDKQIERTELEEAELDVEADTAEEPETIFVYVCGAVMSEGVYELEAESRVYEAIEKAGGFREDAAVSQMNQAALLKDEERLYVPTPSSTNVSIFGV